MRLAPTAIASQRHQGWHLPAQAFEPAVARVIKITRDPMALAATIGIIPETIGPEAANLTAPFAIRRRGIEAKIIAGAQVPASDPTLVRMLTKAHRWMLARQDGTALTEIAHRDGMRSPTLAPASPAFLSPRIQAATLDGIQPRELSVEHILRIGIPLDWREPARVFGLNG